LDNKKNLYLFFHRLGFESSFTTGIFASLLSIIFFGCATAQNNPFAYAMNAEPVSLDLNHDPPIVYEQILEINDKIFNIYLERSEMTTIINRLPKEELKSIIGEDSIRHPLNEFTAQQQAHLRDLATNHFEIKNEIIAEMKSLYPDQEWDFVKLNRDKFFGGRQRDREYSLKELSKMLADLKSF